MVAISVVFDELASISKIERDWKAFVLEFDNASLFHKFCL